MEPGEIFGILAAEERSRHVQHIRDTGGRHLGIVTSFESVQQCLYLREID